MRDTELDELYHRAGKADALRPRTEVRRQILKCAEEFTRRSPRKGTVRPSTWLAIPAAAALLAAFILVPMRSVRLPLPSTSERSGRSAQHLDSAGPSAKSSPSSANEALSPASTPPPATVSPGPHPAPPPSNVPSGPRPAPPSAPRAFRTPPPDLLPEAREAAADTNQRAAGAERRALQRLEPPVVRMQRAAIEGDAAVLTSLAMQFPSVLNARDAQGRTPLMLAVLHHHRESVDALLASGADPNVADDRGRTPLQVAAADGDDDISTALKLAGGHGAP